MVYRRTVSIGKFRPPPMKAVIPSAGMGTRFLPATKAIPKEMLPLVDKPAIQYVVEEAAAAGFNDILMVTGRNKRALEDHFDRAVDLEKLLEIKGRFDVLELVRKSTTLARMHYIRQAYPRGLGDAVLTAEGFIGFETFAVLLGDNLIDHHVPIIPRMLEVHKRYGGSVLALIEVPKAEISLYGAAALASVIGEEDVVRVTGLVEKPASENAPSHFSLLGRYLLTPGIFGVLRETQPGLGGEIQLTDALQELTQNVDQHGPVHGVIYKGYRYDTGDKLAYLQAVVQLAAKRDDLGDKFCAWLKDFVKEMDSK